MKNNEPLNEHLNRLASTAAKLDFFREPRRKEEILDLLSKQIKDIVGTSFLSKRDLMLFYAGMQYEAKAIEEWGKPEVMDVDKKKLKNMSPMELLELMAKEAKNKGAALSRASVCLLYYKLKLEEDAMN